MLHGRFLSVEIRGVLFLLPHTIQDVGGSAHDLLLDTFDAHFLAGGQGEVSVQGIGTAPVDFDME